MDDPCPAIADIAAQKFWQQDYRPDRHGIIHCMAKTPTTVEPMILIEKLAGELPRNPSRFVLLGVGLSAINEAPP